MYSIMYRGIHIKTSIKNIFMVKSMIIAKYTSKTSIKNISQYIIISYNGPI